VFKVTKKSIEKAQGCIRQMIKLMSLNQENEEIFAKPVELCKQLKLVFEQILISMHLNFNN
jgi:hypothetical protein